MKKTCYECKQKRHCRPAVMWLDGEIDYVCRICWQRFYYDMYMHPEGCDCFHCQRQ